VDKKVTYIPTLIVGPNWFKTGLGTPDNHRQDLRWANPFIYGTILDPLWIPQEKWPANLRKFRAGGMPPFAKSLDSVMAVNLKKVVAAGVNVVTGTDAGNPGTMHGSSYLQELEAMERAGMSTAQIIRSATVNAANAFSLNSGTVEKGKIADLLLLTKNPLEKLDHLNSIETIFRSGKMIQADTILREGPEMLVQRQLIAYNAGNIDAFLDTYSNDVILYSFPDSVLEKGKDNMRKMYSPMFNNPKFKPVQIVNRMVVGNKVIDHERVVYGNRTINAVAIYEVRDGKIVKVTFLE
jgi:hypothetical protein